MASLATPAILYAPFECGVVSEVQGISTSNSRWAVRQPLVQCKVWALE